MWANHGSRRRWSVTSPTSGPPSSGSRSSTERAAPRDLIDTARTVSALVPEPHVIVLFGALGDLSRRKLLPGLFHLDRAGLMPTDYRIIGTSRRGGTVDEFRAVAGRAVGDEAGHDGWERFAERLCFSAFQPEDPGSL